jgi:hypothetical protein
MISVRSFDSPVVSTVGARIVPLVVKRGVETHASALSERPQGANSGPKPIFRLGDQYEIFAHHLGGEFAEPSNQPTKESN